MIHSFDALMNQPPQHQDKIRAHLHHVVPIACAVNLTVKQHVHVHLVILVPLQIVDLNVTLQKTAQVTCLVLRKNVETLALIPVELTPDVTYERTPPYVLAWLVILATHSNTVAELVRFYLFPLFHYLKFTPL